MARFGARLRAYRNQHGWVQAELGRAVHVSGTLIAKLEKAERRPQPDVARRLDDVLGADGELARLAAVAVARPPAVACPARPSSMNGSRPSAGFQPAEAAHPGPQARPGDGAQDLGPGVGQLRRLADRYDLPEDGPVRPATDLARAVRAVVSWRLNSDYQRLVDVLPDLLPELTRAMLNTQGHHREELAGLLVQGWRAGDAVASKLGLFDLSARLIHVMSWAARGAGNDGLWLATTSYVRAETFLTSGELTAGRMMLERAAARVSPQGSDEARAQYGALHMRAALTAGRAGMGDAARAHLHEARTTAEQVSEGVWQGTAFGPASVRIHEVSTAIDLDRPQWALATAAGWLPPADLPAERRSHFFVDLARAQLAVGRYDDVIATLRRAYSIAPQNIRVHPHVRQTLAELARVSPANASAASRFAQDAILGRHLRATPTSWSARR